MDLLLNYKGEIIIIISSYFIGSICFGYYLVKLFSGKDIRMLGSGNLGAKNVGRILGTGGFLVTLLGDAGKCYAIVFIASLLSYDPYIQIISIIMTITGHIWPIQLGLRGGKGYATMIGGLLAYDLVLFGLLTLLAGVMVLIVRRLTLGGLGTIVLSPVVALIYNEPISVVVGLIVIAALIIYAHRVNVRRELATV